MATSRSGPGGKLLDAELAVKVFRYNATPSDERGAEEAELTRELEEADRRSTHLDRGQRRRKEQRVREWLEEATGGDGDTDPARAEKPATTGERLRASEAERLARRL